MNEHDQRFKVLIRESPEQFMTAFFAAEAGRLDFSSVNWLEQEQLYDPPTGERGIVDIAAMVRNRYPKEDAPDTILHFEPESGESSTRIKPRACKYSNALESKYGLPVLTVAVFVRMQLDGIGEGTFEKRALQRLTTTFRYPYVALRGLEARPYVDSNNPLAVALASAMRIPKGQRARFKADILRQLDALNVPARPMEMLTECVEAYLVLNEAEQAEYASLARTKEYQMLEPLPHPWVERGRAEGVQRTLLTLGTKRFKEPDVATRKLIESTTDIATLERWFERAIQLDSWAEVFAEPSKDDRPRGD